MPVYYNKSRKSYYIRLDWGGRSYYCYGIPGSRSFSTKAEAKSYYPIFVSSVTGKKDVSQSMCEGFFPLFEAWLDSSFKPSTAYTSKMLFRKYLVPVFKGVPLGSVGSAFCLGLSSRLSRVTRGSRSHVCSLARHFLRYLSRFGAVPCSDLIDVRNVMAPKKDLSRYVWTFDQEMRFLSVIEDPTDKLLFSFLVYYGMRLGEVLGLKYEDFSGGKFLIRRTACFKSSERKVVFTSPKTVNSIRYLPVIPPIKELLPKKSRGFVFKSTWPGVAVMGETSVRRKMLRYSGMAKLKPIKIHGFRHSCASNLLKNGISPRIVAQWLGDNENTVLSVYSHLLPDEKDQIADFYSGFLVNPWYEKNKKPR